MKKYTIALVTADPEIELIVGNMLDELGYGRLPAAHSYSEAMEIILNNRPELLILSSSLAGQKTGDDLAEWIMEKHSKPYFFLNRHEAEDTFNILQVNKQLSEVSTIHLKSQLQKAILNAVQLFQTSSRGVSGNKNVVKHQGNFCFVKEGNNYFRLEYRHIHYIESRENYLKIISEGRNTLVVRATMKEFEELLAEENFIRISRSHIVQINHIEKLNATHVSVHGQLLPLGKTYKDVVFHTLGLKETGISARLNNHH